MAVDSRSRKNDLSPFYVRNVEGMDLKQAKGSGSYGSVYQVTVNGFPCIAKRLHDILVGPQHVNPEERLAISSRFREECMLLSQLRHPNIVQFIGVHCGRRQDDLTLLMEGLYMDLEQCLTVHSSVPLPIRLQILLDVAYGLLYLHSQSPPIVHRDLKASNVLLTSDMRAKLADLGVSKILEVHPLSEVVRSACPGTPGVMPPEALVEKPSYTTKLDIFSFGTLILHVVNHEFPMPFETDTFERGKQHITKRMSSLKKMGEAHCLYPLVIRCLQDAPQRRPSTAEVCSDLRDLSKELPRKFENILTMYEEIRELGKALSGVKTELTEQLSAVERLHGDVLVKTQQMKQYKKQVDGYKGHIEGLEAELGVYQQQRQQLASAQQMGSNMEVLQRERDTLAAQLQKGKNSESEFERRDELEKQNKMLRAYCDRLVQENNELMGVLKHSNIPFPTPPPQPHPLAADDPKATVTVATLSHFDPRHQHEPQYQPQHDCPPQQQHLQQERQPPASATRTNVPRDQGRVQQKPTPQQPCLKEASVCHRQAHLQQQELGGQREAQERVLRQQQLEQQQLAQREAQARALQQQQLENQEAQARALQQKLEQEAQARAIQQQQQLERQEAQARALQQKLEQEAQARAIQQQQQLERQEAQARALQQKLEQEAQARAIQQQQQRKHQEAQARALQQKLEQEAQARAIQQQQQRKHQEAQARALQQKLEQEAQARAIQQQQQRKHQEAQARALQQQQLEQGKLARKRALQQEKEARKRALEQEKEARKRALEQEKEARKMAHEQQKEAQKGALQWQKFKKWAQKEVWEEFDFDF